MLVFVARGLEGGSGSKPLGNLASHSWGFRVLGFGGLGFWDLGV